MDEKMCDKCGENEAEFEVAANVDLYKLTICCKPAPEGQL